MSKKPKFQTLTGMHDILGEEQKYFQKIYSVVENIAQFYGFQKIETPILEETELFSKGTGSSTDVVQKEMYSFRTKGGDYVSLRPEGTPSIVRAYIEHGMISRPQPVKLYHNVAPFFRYERPQAGRYREFHQFDFEVLGEKNSVIDVQLIQIGYNILKELGLKDLIIEINSIGDAQCRPYYKKSLVNYLRKHQVVLCADCKRRLKENPLRILDCKKEKCQELVNTAPQIIDYLCEECHNYFKEVLEFLDELDLPYRLNPFLARGLDYYTKTVFEIFEETEEGKKQGILIAGGRYDGLIKLLGGKDAPACGMAGGVERIMNIMKNAEVKITQSSPPKIFLAQLGELAKKRSLKLLEEFRKAKIPVAESLSRDSLKIQLGIADKLGTEYTLILGQKEALEQSVIVREMTTGRQKTVKLDNVIAEMRKRLKKS
ncbi:histidine--tRNA ligase [Candidatus Parcubacteria bacterium]|nr:histidine--tRNA ligase [Candidatus Parcubacteria bacterium]